MESFSHFTVSLLLSIVKIPLSLICLSILDTRQALSVNFTLYNYLYIQIHVYHSDCYKYVLDACFGDIVFVSTDPFGKFALF